MLLVRYLGQAGFTLVEKYIIVHILPNAESGVYSRVQNYISSKREERNIIYYWYIILVTLDALTALKFTYKGISGLGESGGSVQKIYRYVDPSYLGILDLTTSSNSDPGMSGMICPLTSLYNDHSFSEYSEPNTWRENYEPLHQDKSLLKPNAISPISFRDPSMNTGIPYDTYRAQIEKEELQITKVTCPLRSIIDPKISFGSDTINATKTSVPMKSLFTVISDEDEDVEEENPNKTLYLDDFDDGSDD